MAHQGDHPPAKPVVNKVLVSECYIENEFDHNSIVSDFSESGTIVWHKARYTHSRKLVQTWEYIIVHLNNTISREEVEVVKNLRKEFSSTVSNAMDHDNSKEAQRQNIIREVNAFLYAEKPFACAD